MNALFLGPDGGLAPAQRRHLFHEAIRAAEIEEVFLPLTRSLRDSAVILERLDHYVRALQPNVIVITAGPFPTAMVAAIAAIDVWGIPVLLDFRDPWLSNPFVTKPLKVRLGGGWSLRKLQQAALKRAYVTASSVGLLEEMFGLGAKLGTTILTGADEQPTPPEIERMRKLLQSRGIRNSDFCAYAGGLSGRQYPVAEVISALQAVGLPIVVAGSSTQTQRFRKASQAARNVVVLPPQSPRMVQALHSCAKVSLVIEGPPGVRAATIPVKVYDFLASANAVAGWMPAGSEGELVLRLGMSEVYLVPPGDYDSLVAAVRTAATGKRRVSFSLPEWLTRARSRDRLSEILATIALQD